MASFIWPAMVNLAQSAITLGAAITRLGTEQIAPPFATIVFIFELCRHRSNGVTSVRRAGLRLDYSLFSAFRSVSFRIMAAA